MGQKVNPHGLRVGIIKGWDSKWYADRDYEKYLLEDIKIREFIKDKLFLSGISKVEIERASNRARISIHTAKPGMVIGRQGSNIELLKNDLKKMTDSVIDINIVEVKTPDMDATLVAENIASQLERRIAFRRAMKQAIGRAMKLGAKGIKTQVSGRLGGIQQIAARVACDEVDLVLFFRDPLKADSGNSIEQNLLRLCDMHSVPIATNIATAEVLLRGMDQGDLDYREGMHPPVIEPLAAPRRAVC